MKLEAQNPAPVSAAESAEDEADSAALDEALADAERSANLELQYYAWRVRFSKDSWEWNRFTGQVIFWLVIAIVVFGMIVSAFQFRSDLWLRRYKAMADKAAESGEPIKFEVSPERLAVQSQTIGVIILAASLLFFFLYLEHIYPMNVVKDEDAKFSVGNSG